MLTYQFQSIVWNSQWISIFVDTDLQVYFTSKEPTTLVVFDHNNNDAYKISTKSNTKEITKFVPLIDLTDFVHTNSLLHSDCGVYSSDEIWMYDIATLVNSLSE